MNAIKPRATPEPQTQRLAVRGGDEWIRWIDEAARRTRRTRSSLFEQALADFAKAHGLHEPPPRV